MNSLSRSAAEAQLRAMLSLASGSDWLGCPIEMPTQGVNNQTYIVRRDGTGLVLKLRPISSGQVVTPCLHWPAYTCALYGNVPNGELSTLVDATALLRENGSLPVPRIFIVDSSASLSPSAFLVAELMPGVPFDWESRPIGAPGLSQIGAHLGTLHRAAYRTDSYGIFADPRIPAQEWWPRFAMAYSILADELSKESEGIRELRPGLDAALLRAMETGTPERFVPMCIDQSPSHYLGDEEGNITGFVDIEGHLWGPADWELAILDLWVREPDALRSGYLSQHSLPARFDETKAAYHCFTLMQWMYCVRYMMGKPDDAVRLESHLADRCRS